MKLPVCLVGLLSTVVLACQTPGPVVPSPDSGDASARLDAQMLLQVHDELVFEVPDEELDIARKLVRREMEGVEKLLVPIKVEMKVGRNWYEAETME